MNEESRDYIRGYEAGYIKAKEDEVERILEEIKAGELEDQGYFFKEEGVDT